jgi:hypothetical protein
VFSGAAVTDSANVLGAYARVVVQYQPMGVNPVVALPGASN